jgi:arginyl-tRNA synthetase
MKSQLQSLLRAALAEALPQAEAARAAAAPILLEPTRDPRHGDLATNLALALARPLNRPPRQLAESLVRALPKSELVARVEIAGPGFINFFLAPGALQRVVADILERGPAYGRAPAGTRGKLLLEFVSANPTGPMHVGHGRNAVYGDVLANVLDAAGWQVEREYYVNDAGRQVDVLAVSVWLRYLELGGALPFAFPRRGYPGDYLRRTAEKLRAAHGADAFGLKSADVELPPDPPLPEHVSESQAAACKEQQERYLDALIELLKTRLPQAYVTIRDAALADQLARIRATLDELGVRFDHWQSERALVESGAVERAIEQLRATGCVYERDGALWFDAVRFGDDKPRVLRKSDGSATYFCNDLAYHADKLARGFPQLLDVWGADHHGYVARVQAAIAALTGRRDALQVQLIQFVTLSSGRMGKRSGNFVTLEELIHEVGRDATRFFYLSRSHDQHLEFDLELARAHSNDNPVYYVQYAHARIGSVFRQAAERGLSHDPRAGLTSLDRLVDPTEKTLLATLERYPETLQSAAQACTPHLLTFYLREVADALHKWYGACPFLVEEDALRHARLALAAATAQVLRNGLGLLGVAAPERM